MKKQTYDLDFFTDCDLVYDTFEGLVGVTALLNDGSLVEWNLGDYEPGYGTIYNAVKTNNNLILYFE